MKYLLCIFLTGCSFNYQFEPFKKDNSEVQAVAQQVEKILNDHQKRLKALEAKK